MTGALAMTAVMAAISSTADFRSVVASAMSGSPSALAGQRRKLVPHPMVTLVSVIARMPEQAHRNGDVAERLGHAQKRELPLQDHSQGVWHREQRVAVQREQQASEHGRDARRDLAGKPHLAELAIEQRDSGERIHGHMVACG